MGGFELANFFGSTVLSGVMTIWAKASADRQELHKMNHVNFKATETSVAAARKYRGFSFARRTIALMVIGTVCWAVIAPSLIPGVATVIGYYDTSSGWWPWSKTMEQVHWIGMGPENATRLITIPPLFTNMAMSIIGMFFGNQMTQQK